MNWTQFLMGTGLIGFSAWMAKSMWRKQKSMIRCMEARDRRLFDIAPRIGPAETHFALRRIYFDDQLLHDDAQQAWHGIVWSVALGFFFICLSLQHTAAALSALLLCEATMSIAVLTSIGMIVQLFLDDDPAFDLSWLDSPASGSVKRPAISGGKGEMSRPTPQ
jgi:hypothetical protein